MTLTLSLIHTHTHTEASGTSKASQGLTKCEATTRKGMLFSFPHHGEGVGVVGGVLIRGDTPTLYFPI